jgi:hypothetical protein
MVLGRPTSDFRGRNRFRESVRGVVNAAADRKFRRFSRSPQSAADHLAAVSFTREAIILATGCLQAGSAIKKQPPEAL